jgi:hypothetical protein
VQNLLSTAAYWLALRHALLEHSSCLVAKRLSTVPANSQKCEGRENGIVAVKVDQFDNTMFLSGSARNRVCAE